MSSCHSLLFTWALLSGMERSSHKWTGAVQEQFIIWTGRNGTSQGPLAAWLTPAMPLPPLGHIWDVMLIWRKGNIKKTVSVLHGLQQYIIMPPPRRGAEALSGDRRPSSVRPSVCLSDVAYIGSNSKTKRPRKTKLCAGVPQVTCNSHTDFKIKRSKVKVGRGHIVAAT